MALSYTAGYLLQKVVEAVRSTQHYRKGSLMNIITNQFGLASLKPNNSPRRCPHQKLSVRLLNHLHQVVEVFRVAATGQPLLEVALEHAVQHLHGLLVQIHLAHLRLELAEVGIAFFQLSNVLLGCHQALQWKVLHGRLSFLGRQHQHIEVIGLREGVCIGVEYGLAQDLCIAIEELLVQRY